MDTRKCCLKGWIPSGPGHFQHGPGRIVLDGEHQTWDDLLEQISNMIHMHVISNQHFFPIAFDVYGLNSSGFLALPKTR